MDDSEISPAELRQIADDVSRRLDGRTQRDIDVLRAFVSEHPFLATVGGIVGALFAAEPLTEFLERLQSFERKVTDVVRAMLAFTEHGWVISSQVPIDAYQDVIDLASAGASVVEIDAALTEVWNRSAMLNSLGRRLAMLGAGDEELLVVASERSRLVQLAWQHHCAGAYEASIPIVLAQIDGITHDATQTEVKPSGLSFFSKGPRQADVVDDATVAGIDYGLATVRAWFSQDIPTSGMHRSGSRHGVLHGRDVSYDTKVNSTKCFVLLLAVWEWAQPRLARTAEARRDARYAVHAGSDDVDEAGCRLDRRGFVETRLRLRTLELAERDYRLAHGRYSVMSVLLFDPQAGPLARQCGMMIDVHLDGLSWFASLPSEAGWVFSIGADDDETYYHDGRAAPSSFPPAPEWRRNDDGNWSGDCFW